MNVKRMRMMYLLTAFILIIVEFIIGIFVHDSIIRPYGGDVIVVIILYALVRSVFVQSKQPISVYVFVFAFAYEFTQIIPLVDLLGFSSGFMRALMGTSFSWIDIVCYLAGCILCFGHDIYQRMKISK